MPVGRTSAYIRGFHPFFLTGLIYFLFGPDGTITENDHFIHDMELGILGENKVVSVWHSWAAGEPAGGMTFHLARSE